MHTTGHSCVLPKVERRQAEQCRGESYDERIVLRQGQREISKKTDGFHDTALKELSDVYAVKLYQRQTASPNRMPKGLSAETLLCEPVKRVEMSPRQYARM